MAEAHMESLLPIKNRVMAADGNTVFLAHYDLTQHDTLRGVKAIGSSASPLWENSKFVSEGSQYEIHTNLTLSAWIYPTATPTGDRGCLLIGKGSGGYYLTLNNGLALSVYWHGKTPEGYHSSTKTCPLNTWSHVAAVWSATELRLYINGELDSTIAVTGTGNKVNYVELGTENTGSRAFKGKIGDVGIWADNKSREQIKEIMNIGTSHQEKGLRAFWKMDEGEGVFLRDSSAFHGDITNEPGKSFSWEAGQQSWTLRPKEGKFGGAIAIEEATENIIASTDIQGHGSSLTKTSSLFQGFPVYRNEVTDPNTSNNFGIKSNQRYDLKTTDTDITLSFWVNIIVDMGAYMSGYIRVHYEDGTNVSHRWSYMPNVFASPEYHGKWTRVTTSIRLDSSKTPSHISDWYVYKDNASQGVMDLAMIQIETKAFATSFTEDNRETGFLAYDLPQMGINPKGDWTISGWFKRHPNQTGWASAFGIGNYYAEGESEFTVWTNHNGRLWPHSHDNRSGGGEAVITSNAGELEDWFYLAVTHQQETNEFATYLWTKDRYVKKSWVDELVHPIDSTLYVGRSSSTSHIFNGLIDELRIDKVVRTEEELTAWYESNSPFWPRGIYRKSH